MSFIRYCVYCTIGLVTATLLLALKIPIFQSFRVVFGSFYILFLPGFVLSWVFFGSRQLDLIERIALSFGLSIALVPLMVFYLNMIGMKINLVNTFLTVFSIILTGLVIMFYQHRKGVGNG